MFGYVYRITSNAYGTGMDLSAHNVAASSCYNLLMPNNRQIYDDQLWAHFVTFNCYRRRRLLDHNFPKQILLGVLDQQLKLQSASCIGFVIMPNHVHAIVWFPEPNQLSKFMQGWKRKSSFNIRNWYRDCATNYFDDFEMGDKFWQPKYFAFEIENRCRLEEKLIYMHLNPVRSGMVEKDVDWKWSSARWYSNREGVGVPIGWIE